MSYFSVMASHYYDHNKEVIGTIPAEAIIPLLQQALMGEFQQWDLYTSYRGVLRGLTRDEVGNHFLSHASDESMHIETLQRHITGLGYVPTTERHAIPSADAMETHVIVALQHKYELLAIELYQKILNLLTADENTGLRVDIENILSKEQEHAQDLKMMLGE